MKLRQIHINLNALLGVTPMIFTSVGVFVICILYSAALSFTKSRRFPVFNFIGWDQYERLWKTTRWLVSVENILLYGVLIISLSMVIGYLIAVFMDQNIRQEDGFRTVFLYPLSMSLVVTGLIWQWMMEPNLGIQNVVRGWGWESFSFAPLVHPETALYGVIIAGIWQGTGLTMALMLAGIRGIDTDIWKIAKVEGIPLWRTYTFIALPMMKGAIFTAFILQSVSVVRVYDLIVAQTGGGPGIATEMPAKFVIDHLRDRGNVGLGMAAAMMMLLPILLLVALQGYLRYRQNSKEVS